MINVDQNLLPIFENTAAASMDLCEAQMKSRASCRRHVLQKTFHFCTIMTATGDRGWRGAHTHILLTQLHFWQANT